MNLAMNSLIIRLVIMTFGGYSAVAGSIYVYFAEIIKTTTIEAKFPFYEKKKSIHSICYEYFISICLFY